MATVDYELPPASAFARVFPFAIGGLLVVGLVVAVATHAGEPRVLLATATSVLVAIATVAALAWAIRHPRVRLEDGVLVLGRWPRVRVPAAALDLDGARVVDLETERPLQPVMRLFGTSLPGYRTGWFWLRDGRRAFLVVTGGRRVLFLPRGGEAPLLVGVARPERLLEALRRARG